MLAVLLPLSLACADAGRAVLPAPLPGAPPSGTPPAFPALFRPGEVYAGTDGLYLQYSTRYVLYDDRTFGLQFLGRRQGYFEYPGQYTRKGSDILLTFKEWRWEAAGVLRGDTLLVAYNTMMNLADFTGGAYVRQPRTP